MAPLWFVSIWLPAAMRSRHLSRARRTGPDSTRHTPRAQARAGARATGASRRARERAGRARESRRARERAHPMFGDVGDSVFSAISAFLQH